MVHSVKKEDKGGLVANGSQHAQPAMFRRRAVMSHGGRLGGTLANMFRRVGGSGVAARKREENVTCTCMWLMKGRMIERMSVQP